MGKCDDDKCVFPLTSLQIGDLQSYLSNLSLFLALKNKKLYILADNRPWLKDPGFTAGTLVAVDGYQGTPSEQLQLKDFLDSAVGIVMFPRLIILSISFANSVLYPIFWILWEILYASVGMVLALAGFVTVLSAWTLELIGDIWQSASTIFQFASASEAAVSTYEVYMWQSLWNDLLSQVVGAVRSILNGFVAFFTSCHRYHLGIYNHMHDLIQRILIRAQRSRTSDARNGKATHRTQLLPEASGNIPIRQNTI